uniref:Uncharacterized protein n=1 Tax=Arundo donax TaxID=35708 RepID=A0A0A9FTQ8_ARUDO
MYPNIYEVQRSFKHDMRRTIKLRKVIYRSEGRWTTGCSTTIILQKFMTSDVTNALNTSLKRKKSTED